MTFPTPEINASFPCSPPPSGGAPPTTGNNGASSQPPTEPPADQGIKPFTVALNPDAIPQDLRQRKQWLVWRWTWNADKKKWDKPPRSAHTGQKIDGTNPRELVSFEDALASCRAKGLDGIGLAMADGDIDRALIAVDLDKCRDHETGMIEEWASAAIRQLNTYTEVSPSGRGVRLFVYGEMKGRAGRRHGRVEVYRAGHYVTVTGCRLDGTPVTIEPRPAELLTIMRELGMDEEPVKRPTRQQGDKAQTSCLEDDQIIFKARAARNGAKFMALFDRGDTSEYESASEADMGLLCILAWWCRKDADQMERIFGRSALGEREKWTDREDYRDRSINAAIAHTAEVYESSRPAVESDCSPGEQEGSTPNQGNPSQEQAIEFPLGPLVLRSGVVRKTDSGKVVVQVGAYQDGILVYPFQLSTADSSRKAPCRTLAQMLDDEATAKMVDRVLVQIIALAAVRANIEGCQREGRTLREIVAEWVAPAMQLTHRTDRGLWSEFYAREVGRGELVSYTPNGLLDACACAVDVPLDGDGNPARLNLIRAVQGELGALWADLLGRLPAERDAGLGHCTEAGRRFLRDLILLWTRPQTFEVRKATEGDGKDVAARATLASRVRHQAKPYLSDARAPVLPREKWRQVQDAFAAWWRPYQTTDGEVRIALGMRWDLGSNVGVPLPGVTDQASLTQMGQRFGCLASDTDLERDGVKARLSGGKRLAVLAVSLTDELLEQPIDDDDQPASDTVTP